MKHNGIEIWQQENRNVKIDITWNKIKVKEIKLREYLTKKIRN